MEEASQTLDADRGQTFRFVSLPLMRPGLAGAFLPGFIESPADFGNPLVPGGKFNALPTEITFVIVGSVADPAKAAIRCLILVIVFVFRNMPVGVHGGIAAISQLDKSLDEVLIPLGASSASLPMPRC